MFRGIFKLIGYLDFALKIKLKKSISVSECKTKMIGEAGVVG
jgi:hypothetical protein